MIFAITALLVTSISPQALADAPLTATEYRDIIGVGFDTNWLKGVNNNYDKQHLIDIKARGFTNIRIRTFADVHTTLDDLQAMHIIVQDALDLGLVPIISWINHDVEAKATPTTADRDEYAAWWGRVATKLAGMSHRIGFNLITELSNTSGMTDPARYNEWMALAIAQIRAVSPQRMIILGAPSKTSNTLVDIDPSLYAGDGYMMAEWHLYASGPNKTGGQKNWEGNGSASDRENVTSVIQIAQDWTAQSGLPTWVGAWMPMDNKSGDLNQSEVEAFAAFWTEQLYLADIPNSVNALDHFYDTTANEWLTTKTIAGTQLNMAAIADVILATPLVGGSANIVEATVNAAAATNISSSAADANYSVADEGGEAPTITLYWGAVDGGTVEAAWDNASVQGVLAAGSYSTPLNNLSAASTYYYAVKAQNSAGTSWSTSQSFVTNTAGGPVEIFSDYLDADVDGWLLSGGLHTTQAGVVYEGNGALKLRKSSNAEIAFSTAGYSDIKVTVALRTDGFDGKEALTVSWFDGSNWYSALSFKSAVKNTYEVVSINLPAEASNNANFALRFESNTNGDAEKSYIDALVVEGSN
jgi:hypothetical protein